MESKWITGKDLLESGIQVFELVKAIQSEALAAYDPYTGKLVLDVNTPQRYPAYKNIEEARAGYKEASHRYGFKTEEEKCREDIIKNPGLYSRAEQIDRIGIAKECDENRAALSLAEIKRYPNDTHQYDFNPESWREHFNLYENTLNALLFEAESIKNVFPLWDRQEDNNKQIIYAYSKEKNTQPDMQEQLPVAVDARDAPAIVAEQQDVSAAESSSLANAAVDAYILAIAKEPNEGRCTKLAAAQKRLEDINAPAWKIWDEVCPGESHMDKQQKAERVSKACAWVRANRPDLPPPPFKTA